MARKKAPQTVVENDDFIPADQDLSHVAESANALVKAEAATSENALALAQQLKYDGPISPDALETGIRDSQQRVSMELFAIGSRLLLLKEQCPHGEFMERIERLDIAPRLAQRFMQVSAKFSNASTSTHLQKLGKSKLVELLALDDEEVAELGEEGTVLGLELDDIDRMSCRELRKQLRESKAQSEAKDRLIEKKNSTIDEMHQQLDGTAKLSTPDETLTDLLSQFSKFTTAITQTIGIEMNSLAGKIQDHHAVYDGDSQQIITGHLSQINNELDNLRGLFGLVEAAEWDTPEFETPPKDENQLDMLDEAQGQSMFEGA